MTELAESGPDSWYALPSDEVTRLLDGKVAAGLSSAEAAQRMRRDGACNGSCWRETLRNTSAFVCAAVGSAVRWVGEAVKTVLRHAAR